MTFSLFTLPSILPEPAVQHELFVLGYRNLWVHFVGNTALTALVTWASWGHADPALIWLWVTWMLGTSLAMLLGIYFFHDEATQATSTAQTLRFWQHALWILALLPGIGWGGGGLLMVPGAEVQNLMVMTAFAGAAAYSAASNAHNLPAFGISVGAGTLLLLWQVPRIYHEQAPFVMVMCLLYLIVLSMVARNIYATLTESIRLRLSNQDLAHQHAEQAARAEQANRAKSEFLAAASHDLRQPVHALLLLIEAYRQQEPQAAQHPLIGHIASAGHSIAGLFNGLMELSRLESGVEQPVLTSTWLPKLLQHTLSRVRPEAQRKGLRVEYAVSRRLRHHTVVTDKLLLERILGNLLGNAVRYTERGGLLLLLRPAHASAVTADGSRGGMWLEVWDSGIGIAPADQKRIFAPYVQVGNHERDRTKGLGLGLAIVRQATLRLGLGLSLHSRHGRGSCFRLHLPAKICRPDAPDPMMTTASLRVPAPPLAGRRLLLIDDDPMALQAMQVLLSGWLLDVRTAARGDASVLACCGPDWQPDCVLCDFRLPGELNGIQLLDLVQEHYPRAVGILQTGELVHTIQEQAEEAGYLVLYKPVEPALLASTLSAVLDARPVK